MPLGLRALLVQVSLERRWVHTAKREGMLLSAGRTERRLCRRLRVRAPIRSQLRSMQYCLVPALITPVGERVECHACGKSHARNISVPATLSISSALLFSAGVCDAHQGFPANGDTHCPVSVLTVQGSNRPGYGHAIPLVSTIKRKQGNPQESEPSIGQIDDEVGYPPGHHPSISKNCASSEVMQSRPANEPGKVCMVLRL
jgi:hypothetical protein